MKTCTSCKKTLPESEEYFHKQANAKNGLKSVCKKCRKKAAKIKYEEDKANGALREFENTCEKCGKKFISTHKNQRFCSHSCGIRPEIMWPKALTKEIILANKIARQNHPHTGKFETNLHAKTYSIISPDGDVYSGINLTHFVRNNMHLFGGDREELVRMQLNRLSPRIAKPIPSWKGWTWCMDWEMNEE